MPVLFTERPTSFTWTNECQEAFEELRHRLTTAPILAYPDFNCQFILDTDASDTGIGVVSSQIDGEGRERDVAYGSRLLTKCERRYCVMRRELLAVVTFVKQYCSYSVGQRFILRTDHGALTWLCNFRDPEGQLARWLERLQELDFKTIHRQGKKHTNADALSRLPCRQCGRKIHQDQPMTAVAALSLQPPPDGLSEGLRDAQLADPTLGPLLRGKEAGSKPTASELGCQSQKFRRILQIWDQLIVHSEVLCRLYWGPGGLQSIMQVVVADALRDEILAELHGGTLGGHLGVDKTLARLKERFYWPGHHSDVRDWCQNCGTCAS